MSVTATDPGEQFTLDGNAVAGLLEEVFGAEMTTNPAQCAHCGRVSLFGAMLAYGHAMGTVLRCPACQEVMMRVVERPDALWLDLQGMTYLRLQWAGS